MRKAKSDKSFDESSSSSSITMPADLPQEIIEEILSRLPAKSLVRFSSVSKQWRSLISNPKFIKTNLNHLLLEDQSSNNNNHHRLLLLRSPSTLYSVDYNVSPNPIPVRRNFPLLAVEPQALMILGSCHGMLLIRVNKKSFYLWNPLFRDHTRLPEPYGSFSGYLQLVGFGYDSSIDNYKVVRVFTNNDDSSIRLSDVKQWIEVFTLKKNNSWRRIPDIPFASISFNKRLEGTLANGSIYWLVMQEVDLNHTHNELLMGFDLACEEFRLVRLPDEPVQSKWDYNLIVVRGCLSMVEVYLESPFVVVWLLKEDGKKNEFWSKFMKIPNQDYFYSEPLCFTRSGEVLLSITYEDRFFELLVLYNRENLACRKYSVCGTNLWCEARIFIETLVLPNRC